MGNEETQKGTDSRQFVMGSGYGTDEDLGQEGASRPFTLGVELVLDTIQNTIAQTERRGISIPYASRVLYIYHIAASLVVLS